MNMTESIENSELILNIIPEERVLFIAMTKHVLTKIQGIKRFYLDYVETLLEEGNFQKGYSMYISMILIELGIIKRYTLFQCCNCGTKQYSAKGFLCSQCGTDNKPFTEFADYIFYFKRII